MVRLSMEKRSVDELVSIYRRRNPKEFTDEAFEAIRQVLESKKINPREYVVDLNKLEPKPKKEFGQSAFMGCGTTLFGMLDPRADGSYITTEWFILFCLPVIPMRSLRVNMLSSESTFRNPMIFGRRSSYRILETSRPNVRQVLSVYAFTLFYVGWIFYISIFSGVFSDSDGPWLGGLKGLIMMVVPWIIPWGLHKNALRKAR